MVVRQLKMTRLVKLLFVFSCGLYALVAASQPNECRMKITVGDSLDDSLDGSSLLAADCTDVRLTLVGPGTFRLTRTHALTGTATNITVQSESETRARVSCDGFIPSATDAFLLEFRNWHSVFLYRLAFESCPRGISTVDVENVVIENSSFRYRVQYILQVLACSNVALSCIVCVLFMYALLICHI